MNENQQKYEFIFRAALDVQGYGEIAKELGIDRTQLTVWEKDPVNKTANERTRTDSADLCSEKIHGANCSGIS